MYRYVLFDMDGTVLNTLKDIVDSVNLALRTFGYPELGENEIKHNTGNASRHLITKSCPEGADVEATLEFYIGYYKDHCNDTTRPYDGVPELLKKLKDKGIRLAVVSNKIDPAVKELAEKWYGDLFDVAVGEMPGIRRKPAPDLVFKAMEEMGADPAQTVYVGDTEVDIATAGNSNLPCICVTWGFRDLEEIIDLGADVYCNTTEEVYKAIVEG